MYAPFLVTAPTSTPVSLTEAKAALDVGYTDKDDLITALIAAATAHLDGWTGVLCRCLITQTWRQDFDSFSRCLRLPLFPVASIASVKYNDAYDAEQTISSTNYTLLCDALGYYVEFKETYSFAPISTIRPAVKVTYVAGEAAAPAAIKQAILLMVRHWFDNPTAVVVGVLAQAMPIAVDALIAPYRRVGL